MIAESKFVSSDTSEKRRQNWRSLFWGAIAMATVLLVISIEGPSGSPDLRRVIQISSAVFLCSLFGFWIGFGHGFARFPASVVGTLFAGCCFGFESLQRGSGDALVYIVFCYLILAVVSITLLFLRRTYGLSQLRNPSCNLHNVFQFRVQHILVWTTVVAVLLTVFRQLNHKGFEQIAKVAVPLLGLTCFFSLMSVLQLSTWLEDRVSPVRFVLLLIVVMAFFGFCVFYVEVEGWLWGVNGVCSQAMIGFCIYCLRQQDFRLVALATKVT